MMMMIIIILVPRVLYYYVVRCNCYHFQYTEWAKKSKLLHFVHYRR